MTTEEDARKVLRLVDGGLGLAMRSPTEPCVEWAVNIALGGMTNDNPPCVAQAVRLLGIRLNDSNWSSPVARAKGLRRFAIAQLGSRGTIDEQEFDRRAIDIGRSYVGVAEAYAQLKPDSPDAKFAIRHAHGYADQGDRAQGAQYTVRAAAAAADYYGGETYRDRVFSQYAEQIVGVLRDLRSPGCQWLGLTE